MPDSKGYPGKGSGGRAGGGNQVQMRDPFHFATFFASNTAAIHLLSTIQARAAPDNYSSRSLVVVSDDIGYTLSLSCDPSDGYSHPGKWRIGAGLSLPGSRRPGTGSDLLLCPPAGTAGVKRTRESISSLHAMLVFHKESGALMLRSLCNKPIIYLNGYFGSDFTFHRKSGETCVLFQRHNRLRFGDYEFSLDYVEAGPEVTARLKAERDHVMLSEGAVPSRHLGIFPSFTPGLVWNIWMHQQLSPSVFSGVRLHCGRPVALVTRRYKAGTRIEIARELRNMSKFNEGHQGVLGMIESWCEHGKSPPCQLTDRFRPKDPGGDEDVCYSMPLAEYHFESMPWHQLGPRLRITLLFETLQGLEEIHREGLIHGRIRPQSLMLLRRQSTEPHQKAFRAAISGLAHACYSPSSRTTSHAIQVDIWDLAVSWIYAFKRPPDSVQDIETAALRAVRDIVLPDDLLGLRGLWLQMLAPSPDDRPTVQEALAHEVWQKATVKKREDETEPGVGRSKRVRLVSPEADDKVI